MKFVDNYLTSIETPRNDISFLRAANWQQKFGFDFKIANENKTLGLLIFIFYVSNLSN